ncbi:MAG: metallophosphoesterase [Halodesulfurarchaeum sp.]
MSDLEPIQGEPAAVADLHSERALVVADYHAGIERTYRREGIEVTSRAEARREALLSLVESRPIDRVVFLGDLGTHIGQPESEELEELQDLDRDLPVPATLVPGNHDGLLGDVLDIDVVDSAGVSIGDIGFAHGHRWPGTEPLSASILAVGHEHPCVRLEDTVGGSRIERVWLRGTLDPAPFEDHVGTPIPDPPSEIVVFPAFNDLTGGTWVNVEDQDFLSPFLPEAAPDAEAYLVDGTRLGPIDQI